MRLSRRIYDMCSVVSHGETIADIGTDHGYVPMILVRDGISPYAIMSDISADSLSKAVETFHQCRLPSDYDMFRVGDGLDTIGPGEVDDVIIGGLGGHTIVQILADNIDKTRSFRKLILQPRKHSGKLRAFLFENGFDITEEKLTSEGKFICEIIVARPSDIRKRELPYSENDIRWAYPETLSSCDKEHLIKRVSWKLGSIEEQIENLKLSADDSDERIIRLKNDHEYLRKLIGTN